MVLSVLIAAASSYLVSQRLSPVYQASATILVGQSIQATELDTRDILTSERIALTYANVARRRSVLQGVVEALGLSQGWRDLQERVRVELVQDTQLLEVTVEAGSPEEARAIADEVARQLILLSPTALQDEEEAEKQQLVRQRLENLQARIESGLERLVGLEAEMTKAQSAGRLQEVQNEIDVLQRFITDWEMNHTQLLALSENKQSPNYLAIIDPAQATPDPVRPRIMLNTLIAGVAGLAVAIGIASLLEYLDDTLKLSEDLKQSLSLTPLGTISQWTGNGSQHKLIAAEDPFSANSESYRMMRSNIQFTVVDRALKTCLITSPGPGEGKSTTVANLGVVMAQAGLKTIIVDADLRRPVQHRIFKSVNLGGLTDLLTSTDPEITGYLRSTSLSNLQLITSGFPPPNPSELLGSQRMTQLLARLCELADVVILDSPPAAAFADAVVLSNRVDGVILVTEAGKTRRDIARRAISNLQQAGGHLLGAVLNRVSSKSGDHRYYRYYSSYKQQGDVTGAKKTHPRRRWQWLPFMKLSK
jgi:non-specific protein-tyrosine kinase